jgi:RecA-family ATPase
MIAEKMPASASARKSETQGNGHCPESANRRRLSQIDLLRMQVCKSILRTANFAIAQEWATESCQRMREPWYAERYDITPSLIESFDRINAAPTHEAMRQAARIMLAEADLTSRVFDDDGNLIKREGPGYAKIDPDASPPRRRRAGLRLVADNTKSKPPPGDDDDDDDDDASQPKTESPLPWLDMSSWDNSEPAPIEWSITNLVPREQVGLFSGVGGTGKTTTELLKDVAHVVGLPWLNWMPTQGPVIFVGCEDADKVWRIRLTAIAKHFGTTFYDLIAGGFHLLNLYGQDATLFHHSGKSGRVETTPLYQQIYQAAGDLKPINISLDPLARIFAGNEMDRTQVYGLVGHAQALALASGGSVTVLTHPSLQGIRSGSGYSGSTAWHDAFRFRQYLRAAKDDDDEPVDPANDHGLRELTFMKIQYGPPAAKLTLRWRNGLFLPESGSGGATDLEKLAENTKADTAFLDLLDRFTAQGRNVGAAPNSPNYAPTMFAKEGCGFNRKQLEAAMSRLFNASKIHVESYRQHGHERERIARL